MEVVLEICIQSELVVLLVGHDPGLLVIADPRLEEVGLSVQGDVLHEVERVLNVVDLRAAQLDKESVSHELDVDAHEGAVHADEINRQSFGQEFCLNDNGLADDLLDPFFWRFVHEVVEHEAGEVGVQALVAGDELIAEGETGHEPAFLEPENCCKTSREKYSFDWGVSNDALCIGSLKWNKVKLNNWPKLGKSIKLVMKFGISSS